MSLRSTLALVLAAPLCSQVAVLHEMTECGAIEARLGGTWFAHRCAATGTPDRIYGTGWQIADWRHNDADEVRRVAGEVLRRHGDLLGLGDCEFRERTVARMGHCWAAVYDQYWRGLPVVGGRADVRIHEKGILAAFGSSAVPIPGDFAITPRIGEDTATLAAALHLRLTGTEAAPPRPLAPPRLVVYADVTAMKATAPQLAWEIATCGLDRDGNGPLGRVYVAATDGHVLEFCSDKHACHEHHDRADGDAPDRHELAVPAPTTITVLAWTRTAPSGIAPPTNVPLAFTVVNVAGLGAFLTDQNGQLTIDIAAPVTVSLANWDGPHCAGVRPLLAQPAASITVTPGVPATLQVYTSAATDVELAYSNSLYWTTRVNTFARGILGNTPELAVLDSVLPTVNIGSACNAFYVGNTINFYAAGTFGAACNNTAFSTVIAHEWGHGLDDRYGGISNGATDGLSEGWGDIVAMYLLDTPDVALDFYSVPGSVLRSGNNNTLFGTQTEVHAAGQSWMGFAWLVRENLRTLLGQNQALSISNSIVLGSIVANARTQPDAVVEVFLADDDDGNLLDGVPHYAALSGAAISKGLPFPQQQIAVLTHTPLADTDGQSGARGVAATAFAVTSGTIQQVVLTYALNGGPPVVQPMVHNQLANGYAGLIPGIASGQVTYHVEALHSSGTLLRSPAVGDHTYAVTLPAAGPFTGFWLEDFEGGAAGWTHGRVGTTGTDDWQIGRLSGFNGTSQGIQWSDPQFPVSGQRAAGTSINGGGGNGGLYSASSDSWLRAPVIDCTGRIGVHLQFRRWLTVQDHSFDQATLFVNGVPVWTNQSGQHHLDTQWAAVELVLPMADNNPAVQLEWHLTTDATLQLGGWAIDDVELGTRAQPVPPPRLQILPEVVPNNVTVSIAVHTAPGMPILFYVADQPGPTIIPGLPPIALSGQILGEFLGFADPAGNWTMPVPTHPLPFGLLTFAQALTFDASGQIALTNPTANLLLP